MNHIYRSIWNEALGAWVAVSEITKGQGKRSSNRRKHTMTASPLKDWQSFTPLLATSLLLCTSASFALPTGDQLVAGQATVSNPAANQLQINQTSQQAIVNWQGFSIAPNEAVNIQQPNANAALLNRVVGQDASQIQGQLNANGQVYLVNPNGVVFSKTAQVDVGGLIATTHDISNQDFMAGKNHFTQNGATGTVENHGTINVPNGGVVALIGEKVTNTGNINTPNGTTALAAGKTVDLDFKGDGLVEVKVTEAALNAQITNKGAIQADGGRVVLSAKAAGQLIDTVINQDGIIKAQGLVQRNGEIILDGGDSGTVKVSGTVDTSTNQGLNSTVTNQGLNSSTSSGSPNLGLNTGGNITVKGAAIELANSANVTATGNSQGGNIQIGDKQTTQSVILNQGSSIQANVIENGDAGHINILAKMDTGKVNVQGTIHAKAIKQGNGGFIDTSAAKVKIADSAKIDTQGKDGKAGSWLIDPYDFTIGTDITGAALSSALNSSSVTIQTLNTGISCTGATITCGAGNSSGNGDIFVNDAVSWTANNTLTLNAYRNININANITSTGATGKLELFYGQGSTDGVIAGNASDYFINNGAKVNLAAGQNFSTQKGSDAANLKNYTVITDLGTETDASTGTNQTLQGMARTANLSGLYALGADIDATATKDWNFDGSIYQGFLPVGTYSWLGGTKFTGQIDGLGHTITGLTINRSNTAVGLFGANTGIIQNMGLQAGTVTGQSYTGGLVGINLGTVSNAYATGTVTGQGDNIGGLVGYNNGTLSNAYATGTVTGQSYTGGLVGYNDGTVSNAYATGTVTGQDFFTGGLVGSNWGTVSNAYATGTVTGQSYTGGLAGDNVGTVSNAYATGKVTGQACTVVLTCTGGLIGDNSETVSNAFWNIETTGQTNGIGYDTGTSTNVLGKTTANCQPLPMQVGT
jgi:filamentous hemagglutinin family protein